MSRGEIGRCDIVIESNLRCVFLAERFDSLNLYGISISW